MADCGGGERSIGVAIDFSSCNSKPLKWAVENLVREGDYLILITVLPEGDYEDGEMQLWEVTGSPLMAITDLSDPKIMRKYGVHLDAETLDLVNIAADQIGATVLMKIYWGDAREKICDAVNRIPLSSLVIGSRGLAKWASILGSSVSNYIVDNAACPVTVVKH